MLDELKGYIGLKSDGDTEAQSGLYVDALPDITLSVIEKIATNAEEDGCETWDRIETRAILKFRTLFINEVNKCHKINDIGICECLIISNKEALATSLWYLLGAEVMLTRGASSRINSATIDRNKPKELRQYFEEQFQKELSVAVHSIDVHNSECFQNGEVPEPRAAITFERPII